MLKTGNGGIDWAGLPLIAGWLGLTDIDGLLHRLATLLIYRPEKD